MGRDGLAAVNQELIIDASDGYRLAASLFLPEDRPVAQIVVAPATGVPRQYYRHFAGYLAEEGFAVLTFDYRGIGGSRSGPLRGLKATASDWGTGDIVGAVQFLRSQSRGEPLLMVGHSIGGQLLGMANPRAAVDGALFVAAQSGYWKHWKGFRKLQMLLWWYGVLPVMTTAFGYLPGRLLGGENIPFEAAREWASWGRHPDYVLSSSLARTERGYEQFDRPIHAFAFTDDWYAPLEGAQRLLAMYPNARTTLESIDPQAIGAKSIGHFGSFRKESRETLWQRFRDRLMDLAKE